MAHYLNTNSSRVLAELYRNYHGYNVIQAACDRLNIVAWNVDDNGTPVAQPDSHNTWFTVQDFTGILSGVVYDARDPATHNTEFAFWVKTMVDDSRQVYSETVINGAGQYHTNQQKSLLDHQAQLTQWESNGFPANSVPHYVQSRYDRIMGGAAGNANSYIYQTDLSGLRWYTLAENAVVDFGKIAVMALRAENYMTTEESALIEDAINKTAQFDNFTHDDPFADLEDKIAQYNGLLLDFDHANPDNWGLKQRWENMPVATWESDLGLVPAA